MINKTEEELLKEIFGDNTQWDDDMTIEDKYDAIMREGREVFDYQEKVGSAYSFHKAFEHCLRRFADRKLLGKLRVFQSQLSHLREAVEELKKKAYQEKESIEGRSKKERDKIVSLLDKIIAYKEVLTLIDNLEES